MVIELLEGKPPYHFLDPMPALFRIVQDDCPPIPEGASPIVKDFLYHCFQKDVNLRISAKKLLRHPWMISARKHMGLDRGGDKKGKEGGKEGGREREKENDGRRPLSNYNYDEAVLKVQEWNEALKCKLRIQPDLFFCANVCFLVVAPTRPSKVPVRGRPGNDTRSTHSPTPSPVDSHSPPGPSIPSSSSSGSQQTATQWNTGPALKAPLISGAMVGPLGLIEKSREPLPFILQPPEEQTDNWDDDFEEGISLTKLQGVFNSPPLDIRHLITVWTQRWTRPRLMKINLKVMTMLKPFARTGVHRWLLEQYR